MKALSYLVSLTLVICGLAFTDVPASAAAGGHHGHVGGDIEARRRKDQRHLSRPARSREYHRDDQGERCRSDRDGSRSRTGRLSGKLMPATKMSGTVTGWSSNGSMPWSAEKKK